MAVYLCLQTDYFFPNPLLLNFNILNPKKNDRKKLQAYA